MPLAGMRGSLHHCRVHLASIWDVTRDFRLPDPTWTAAATNHRIEFLSPLWGEGGTKYHSGGEVTEGAHALYSLTQGPSKDTDVLYPIASAMIPSFVEPVAPSDMVRLRYTCTDVTITPLAMSLGTMNATPNVWPRGRCEAGILAERTVFFASTNSFHEYHQRACLFRLRHWVRGDLFGSRWQTRQIQCD